MLVTVLADGSDPINCSNPINLVLHARECAGQGIGSVISKGANDTLQQLMNNTLESFGKVMGYLGTMWVNVPTPTLDPAQGDSTGAYVVAGDTESNFNTLLGWTEWIGLSIAGLCLIFAAIVFMFARNGGVESASRIGIVLMSVLVISGGTGLVALAIPRDSGYTSSSAVGYLQNSTWFIVLFMAAVSVVIAGIRMAWEQRAAGVLDIARSLLTLLMVSTIGLTIVALLVKISDAVAVGILSGATDCSVSSDTGASSCFGTNLFAIIGLTSQSPIGTLAILLLGLLGLLMTFVQIALMVVRSAMLVLLAGALPITASFTTTNSGRQWFQKSLGWLIAFILYKPAAAFVYAAAFKLVGTDLFQTDGGGPWSVLTGLALMLIALIALPALMRFVTPLVQSAGGAAQAAVMAGAGAFAGDMASGALRSLSNSSSNSTNSQSMAQSSQSNISSSPSGSAASGGPGKDGQGQTGASGSKGSPGGPGSTGAETAGKTGTTGAGATGSAGAAGSSGAAAGGGAAASGAAAAAGPVGIGVVAAEKVADGVKKGVAVARDAAQGAVEEGQ